MCARVVHSSKENDCFLALLDLYVSDCYAAMNAAASQCRSWPNCDPAPSTDTAKSIDYSKICEMDYAAGYGLFVPNTPDSPWPALQRCFYNAIKFLRSYNMVMWKSDEVTLEVDQNKGGVAFFVVVLYWRSFVSFGSLTLPFPTFKTCNLSYEHRAF